MTTKTRPAHTHTSNPGTDTACHLYDADPHAAHQSHVDAWITAASQKLHQAVVEHIAATAAQNGPEQP
jgi:hypothetical protein